jgi:[acyl-carrier-protein] S-malonyltransferase
MSGRLAILCPGQGTQHEDMFSLACTDAAVQAELNRWNVPAACGWPDRRLDALLTDRDALFDNRVAQPMVVAASYSAWLALKSALPQPALACGYSIGELTAYAVAQALTPENLLSLAAQRAALMSACAFAEQQHVLVAIGGLDRDRLASVLLDTGFFLAIETPASAIVGGTSPGLPVLLERLAASHATTQCLRVNVAAHTPLMSPAAAPFKRLLDPLLKRPLMPVVAGISGERVVEKGAATTTLAAQIDQPIRWTECMHALEEYGITVALELGPGATLTRLLQASHPAIACRSVSQFRTLRGVIDWVGASMR